MGWNDFYRRRDELDAVLRRAEPHPEAPLDFDPDVFADADELLLALHHRWLQQLTGRLGVALTGADDRAEVVLTTWRVLAAEQPALRGVLDAHLTDREAVEREERLLALTAGLAELSEPSAEVARIGAAFLALIRSEPAVRTSRKRLLSRA
ncbi:hypothetical protein [Umezawaea sp. Da 62-37]|uniref:hypothetical protein n=1 Tax=Umezawaea sp. Da 62-37 TaxID=3075927 RepID=UPI0028F70B08|nr:hypothetical protein [Umezawaea sp. Da 62-37]WNV83506.1 hypothetical protein RM788_35760 [Umezawaea sp. Da 62-37]